MTGSGATGPAGARGVPGLVRLDHVGFTVPDLEAARAWLEEVLGCEYLYSLGPFERDGAWMVEHLGVDPGARMERLHFFRLGGQVIFEVFQYAAPDQRQEPPRNSDVGGHHVALYVEDMDQAVAWLQERGVEVMGEPTRSSGPSEGQRWVYFRAPWGMQFELVSYPGGKAFDRVGGTAAAWAAHLAAGGGTASG
ncbi:VOC family protein [Aciditerrimonas ferrireducens]|uniref:VOC family protein n=1 Tax=Aciditerrimonas ferrireducens TaxID=667306 RepID=UPI002004163A|nr:VOC family protein [Aciditerrimonas ferrireducens]MCK4177506.1 VOC family protein [Aciditerrimonas ferrireducens]